MTVCCVAVFCTFLVNIFGDCASLYNGCRFQFYVARNICKSVLCLLGIHSLSCLLVYSFFWGGAATQSRAWRPHFWGFWIIHIAAQSAGLLWTSDQFVAETSVWQHNTHSKHPCPRRYSNLLISAGERPQTGALGRTATGTSWCTITVTVLCAPCC